MRPCLTLEPIPLGSFGQLSFDSNPTSTFACSGHFCANGIAHQHSFPLSACQCDVTIGASIGTQIQINTLQPKRCFPTSVLLPLLAVRPLLSGGRLLQAQAVERSARRRRPQQVGGKGVRGHYPYVLVVILLFSFLLVPSAMPTRHSIPFGFLTVSVP
jgi:hypothetical protein